MNTWWNLSICRLSSKNVRSVRYPLRLKREAFKVLYFKERHLMAFQTFQRVRWFSLRVYVLFWRQSRAWRLRWHPPNGNFYPCRDLCGCVYMQYSVHTFNIILCNNHIKNVALYKCHILTTPFCANVTRMSRDTSSSVGPLQASFNLSFCINYALHISQEGHF